MNYNCQILKIMFLATRKVLEQYLICIDCLWQLKKKIDYYIYKAFLYLINTYKIYSFIFKHSITILYSNIAYRLTPNSINLITYPIYIHIYISLSLKDIVTASFRVFPGRQALRLHECCGLWLQLYMTASCRKQAIGDFKNVAASGHKL